MWCSGYDSNIRSPKAEDLQSPAIATMRPLHGVFRLSRAITFCSSDRCTDPYTIKTWSRARKSNPAKLPYESNQFTRTVARYMDATKGLEPLSPRSERGVTTLRLHGIMGRTVGLEPTLKAPKTFVLPLDDTRLWYSHADLNCGLQTENLAA